VIERQEARIATLERGRTPLVSYLVPAASVVWFWAWCHWVSLQLAADGASKRGWVGGSKAPGTL
jgi:hypothetical protein